jgi:hypothetical protein
MATGEELVALVNAQLRDKGTARAGAPRFVVTPEGAHMTGPEGTELEVVGTAENAMEGAVVVTDSGGTYFVEGVTEWDDATLNRRIVVKGTMVRKKLAPDPVVGPDGSVSHGAKGRSKVLTNPTWRLE